MGQKKPSVSEKKNIVVLASGTGTNALNIIGHFKTGEVAKVVLVMTNNPNAPVIEKAKAEGVSTYVFNKTAWSDPHHILNLLKRHQPDLIVLAGFLWLVPEFLINAYPDKIINIHPALLPKYGGKGMYGLRVHKAVKDAGEKETGITIHKVNNKYDEGEIIFQARCPVSATDGEEEIANKIHQLEQTYFPQVIEKILTS